MFLDFKFPKLSSESPVNRLKSKTPVQLLTNSEILVNKSLSKIIHQKKKFLKINESLASKYFTPECVKSPNTISVSPTNSTRPSLNKRLWDKELECINSKFYKNELEMLKFKGNKESLPSLQQEFFLFKDYVEELCGLYSNYSKDLGTCVKRGVLGLAQVFSRVFKKCTMSESSRIVETCVKLGEVVEKRKDLRNLGIQTEDQYSDISEDELENLKSLKDRIKSVRMPLVINKLIDLKQAIIDMYTIIPTVSETPNMPQDSYKSFLKLINSQFKTSEKKDSFMQTEENTEELKTDQETQIYGHIEESGISEFPELDQYTKKIEDLEEESKKYADKIIWLESQILIISQGKHKKRVNRQVQVNFDQDLFLELQKLNLDSLQKLAQIEFAWEVMTGYKFPYDGTGIRHLKRQLSVENIESIEIKLKEHSNKRKGKGLKVLQETLGNLCSKCKGCINEQDLENEIARALANSLANKRKREVFENLYRNTKGCQTLSEDCENCERNKEILREYMERNGEVREKGERSEMYSDRLMEIYRESDDKEGMCRIFDEEEVRLLSRKFKVQLLDIFKDHFKKKCSGVCLHLKRAMEMKKKVRGKLFPVKKVVM